MAEELYQLYAVRVRQLVQANLSRGVLTRVDAEDILQSVFRRLLNAGANGLYQVPSGEDLWRLIVTITLNRVRSEELYQRAAKRDVRQTVGEEMIDSGANSVGARDGAVAFLAIEMTDLLERLPAQQREVIRLRLEGYEVAEIATRLGRAKRTVERLLQEARSRLQAFLEVPTDEELL